MDHPLKNIEKRIKRHVLAKPHSFFIATLPGLEKICADQLLSLKLPINEIQVSKGGVEFSGRVHDCYAANLHLRTANRLLMRINSFTATNFRQLSKRLSKFSWDLYLKEDAAHVINVSSKKSRLIHTEAIADRFRSSLAASFGKADFDKQESPDESKPPQQIFVRAENDTFNVSIDSSGDILYKRGLKLKSGKAPIRETFASAILTLAGYQAGEPLIDPMCGSGTFSLEAAMITNNIPSGWYRDFAFTRWPCFKHSRWSHIRREAEKNIRQFKTPIIFASDINPENCLSFEKLIKENNFSDSVTVFKKDFFDIKPTDFITGLKQTSPKGLIAINPPYGHRIKTEGNSEQFYKNIFKKLKADFKGWKMAMLIPDKRMVKKMPFKVKSFHFTHGGLNITLVTGKIR